MNHKQIHFRHNHVKALASTFLPALVFLCAASTASRSWAQSPIPITFSSSDPSALTVVRKAVTALGGAGNWQNVEASTAQASVARPGRTSKTIQWADDWHSGTVLSRRDSTETDGKTVTMITLKNQRSRSVTGGTAKTLPRENDLSMLALGLPAPALILSLKRSACTFHFVRSSSYRQEVAPEASNPTIEEDCRDPFFPSTARLTWTFSASTGLPMQVRLPVRLLLHNGIAYETAKFDQFASQRNLVAPSQVTVVLPTGQTEEFQIAHRAFASALPASTFARP